MLHSALNLYCKWQFSTEIKSRKGNDKITFYVSVMLPAKLLITLVIATKYNFSIGSVDLFVKLDSKKLHASKQISKHTNHMEIAWNLKSGNALIVRYTPGTSHGPTRPTLAGITAYALMLTKVLRGLDESRA